MQNMSTLGQEIKLIDQSLLKFKELLADTQLLLEISETLLADK